MISRNGRQLASRCLTRNGNETIAPRFFKAFWRWSRVGCPQNKTATRRSITTNSSSEFVHFSPPKAKSTSSNPQIEALRNSLSQEKPTTKPSSKSPEPALSTSLRQLMRTLPHSVVVLTSTLPRIHLPSSSTPNEYIPQTPQDYRGMTLSSFTTLTLTPEPIITFNVKNPSRTLQAVANSRHFLIHVLEASERGMRIADAFTKGNGEGNDRSLFLYRHKELFEVEERRARKWDGREVGLPMLKGEGVRAVLACSVLGTGPAEGRDLEKEKGAEGRWTDQRGTGLIRVGDHLLVLGKVEEIITGHEGGGDGGLCYAHGKYRRVGNVIKKSEDVE